MEKNGSSSSRVQRNMKERDRRTRMRHLFSSLAFVLQPQPSKMTVLNLVDEAIDHVKQMRTRIEILKLRKAGAQGYVCMEDHVAADNSRISRPVLDIISGGDDGSILQVNLRSGLNEKFIAHDVIRVLQEGGAEVISFSSHNVGDRIIHTIKSKAICPRIGIETLNVHERLKRLTCGYPEPGVRRYRRLNQ